VLGVVSDTGPLIWLARYGRLDILRALYGVICIPRSVYVEAVERGSLKGFPDSRVIGGAVADGWIEVRDASEGSIERVRGVEERLKIRLGAGEREAIALALDLSAEILLTNDELAYRVAKLFGLTPRGVLYLLLRGVREGLLGGEEAWKLLNKMVEDGFWISPTLIVRFREVLDKMDL